MKIFRKLAWYFRLRWQRYTAAGAILALVAALVMVPPWLTGRIVDTVTAQRLSAAQLYTQVGIIIGIGVVVYGLRYLWRTLLYGASYRLGTLLRQRIYRHLCAMPPGFFQQYKTGDLMARATNDITAVEMSAGEAVLSLFDGALTGCIVLAIMLFAISWKLTLLALLPWPVMTYCMWRFGNALHDAFGVAQARFSDLNEKAQESIGHVRLLRAFGQEQAAQTAFRQAAVAATAAGMAVARTDAKYDPVISLTIGSSFLIAVGGGAWLIEQGALTLGELTSFTMYLGYLIWPMFAFGWLFNLVERGSAAYERIEALLSTAPPIADHGHIKELDTPSIRFAVERFAYPGSGEILGPIDITVPAGRTLGIVGATASGKSTLLNLLLRLEEHPAAHVFLGEHAVADYTLTALRSHIAVVPQDPFLFSATIAENIALAKPDATRAQIERAAQLANIAPDIEAFPDGYETLVGERGITLSGGQKQRIAIARALLLDAPVLVLDDALSAVDVGTETRILQALRAARRGRTTLIVSHRLSAVADADRIIVLSHGRIAEQGTHAQLLRNNGWYARMHQYQQIERAVAEGR